MNIYGKVEKTKIVTKSLEVPSCTKKTNRFSLSDTVGLLPGMILNIPGQPPVELISIDCSENITIDKKVVIQKNAEATFKHEVRSAIKEISSQLNNAGQTCIDVVSPIDVVDGMELEFDDDISRVRGTFAFTGSGSDTITLTSNISISKFGLHDTTYTWNLDDFITRTPNARDYDVVISKAAKAEVIVNLNNDDTDLNSSTKVAIITQEASNGVANVRSTGTITYTPFDEYVGEDVIFFVVIDGAEVSGAPARSVEKRINITIK